MEGPKHEHESSLATEFPQLDDGSSPSKPDPSISVPAIPAPPLEPSPTAVNRLKHLQDLTVGFLANASNETLGACAVGLGVSTYLVLGRVGLVLIGAVGGVVLHATWENSTSNTLEGNSSDGSVRRKELGVDIVKRALDWRDKGKEETKKDLAVDKIETSTLTKPLDFSEFQPATGAALTGLTDAIVRDYVHWWYKPILPTEDSFPTSCRQTLTSFLLSISNHLSRKRAADPFLDFVANSTSIIIVFLNELSTALKASQRQDAQEAIRTYLHYQPDSNLANVISAEQHERKLRLVADDILQSFLESKTYNCAPARTFLREVLAILILQSTINSCSKAEWINGWIVYLLEEGEPEIMNAIDAGVEEMEDRMKSISKATPQEKTHQRRVSRAEEAMQEAMREAQRLNEMIAEDEARRKRGLPSLETEESLSSTATTDVGVATPTSSDSDRQQQERQSMESSIMFDNDGNVVLSATNSPRNRPKKPPPPPSTFTDFDQLTPSNVLTALQTEYTPPAPAEVMLAVPLTLHNASITILDMGESNDKVAMKQKPNDEMLVQIEPSSSRFPGWMITRKYADFEPLHETLRRIAVISGVPEFAQQYPTVPPWKSHTRSYLIQELERYLKTALKSERLAESEAMKKFLDKETGLEKAPAANKNVLLQGSAALENVGKGFISAIGQGGKGLQTGIQTGGKAFQTGGKVVLGGVQGVFGAVAGGVGGPKRPNVNRSGSSFGQTSTASPVIQQGRFSQDVPRPSTETNDYNRLQTLPSSSSSTSLEQSNLSTSSLPPVTAAPDLQEQLNLPPPPSEISDEFDPDAHVRPSTPQSRKAGLSSAPMTPTTSNRPSTVPSPAKEKEPVSLNTLPTPPQPSKTARKQDAPLTEEETRVSIDLIFAIITELFALAPSAWTIRLSLLSAAKTFLVRPANPQLESIRVLLQESVLDANFTSDTGLAAHINKLRENSLPTEEELAKWPAELTVEEKEKLRVKARKLLVERGMPSALTGVMGQAACGEALGRVFDCLQVEEVARGLVFALLLQAVRAVTQ